MSRNEFGQRIYGDETRQTVREREVAKKAALLNPMTSREQRLNAIARYVESLENFDDAAFLRQVTEREQRLEASLREIDLAWTADIDAEVALEQGHIDVDTANIVLERLRLALVAVRAALAEPAPNAAERNTPTSGQAETPPAAKAAPEEAPSEAVLDRKAQIGATVFRKQIPMGPIGATYGWPEICIEKGEFKP